MTHITIERAKLELALGALEEIALAGMSGSGQESEEAMTAWHARQAWKFIGIAARALKPIKQALAAPVQEPVALQMDVIVVNLVREGINKHRARELAEHFIKHTTPPAAQPAPVQQSLSDVEPVAWMYWQSCLNDDGTQTAPWVQRYSKFKPPESVINKEITPLYTTPPAAQRQWVGLTDDQKLSLEIQGGKFDVMLAELVEGWLKEKNHG